MISHTPQVVKPLQTIKMSTVEPIQVNWVWYPYIPRKAFTLLYGDGGLGKSWMTCALAADLSAGKALPGQEALPPMRVLMINAEDGIGETVHPRLMALGANLENIYSSDEAFSLNEGRIKSIMAAINDLDVAIVFFDPMVVYTGGLVDSHKANEVRALTAMLTAIAKEKDIAIVGVHHINKASNMTHQHRVMGSVDWTNGCRSTLMAGTSKTGQHYMAHIKANWSKKGPAIAYAFTGDSFQWLGEYNNWSADGEQEICMTPRGAARAFLIATLRDGPVGAVEVLQKAHDEKLTEGTITRAKKGLVKSVFKEGKWYWHLVDSASPHPEAIGFKPEEQIEAVGDLAPSVEIISAEENEMDRLVREAQEKLHDTSS